MKDRLQSLLINNPKLYNITAIGLLTAGQHNNDINSLFLSHVLP